MSLRTRLVVSLALTLAVALLVAGVLVVQLTRASLVERVDRELLSITDGATGSSASPTSRAPTPRPVAASPSCASTSAAT